MTTYCGFIGLVGRPNVGKSTLLNRFMSQKISITSRKPQTTRHRILGIQTVDDYQFVFVDTPGVHHTKNQTMNQMMNKTALTVLRDVDVVLWLIDATRWTNDDELVLKSLADVKVPVFLVVNKIDRIKDKDELLPKLQKWQHMYPFKQIIPISAKTGDQLPVLFDLLKPLMPESPHLYYPEMNTDRPIYFQMAEILREKVFRYSGDEIPYSTIVEVESMKEEGNIWRIHALIWVDKESHKRMLIGAKGIKMKQMSTEARQDMEQVLGKKVFLHCFCKVKSGWSQDVRFLREMGLDD